jgi:hypothetical protein
VFDVKSDSLQVKYAINHSFYDGIALRRPPVATYDNKESLHGRFRELLKNKAYCDLTIDIQGKKFEAHKLVLIARSPVFEAMFTSNLTESTSNTLKIDDIEPRVFNELLLFLYTDFVNDLKRFAAELLIAADKYMLKSLKAKCETSLARNINITNCCDMLLLADLYSALDLKTFVLEFIQRHLFSITQTPEWSKLMAKAPPKLFKEMAGILM